MANTTTSITGPVASHVASFPINGHAGAVQLEILYTKGNGTSVAISPIEFLIPDLSATEYYTLPASSASGTTLSAYTLTISTSGNYVIVINYVPMNAREMKVTVAYTGGTTAAVAINAYTDVN